MPDRYGEEPDHHTTHAEAAKRGMALIRAAMGWPLRSTESDETTTDGTL